MHVKCWVPNPGARNLQPANHKSENTKYNPKSGTLLLQSNVNAGMWSYVKLRIPIPKHQVPNSQFPVPNPCFQFRMSNPPVRFHVTKLQVCNTIFQVPDRKSQSANPKFDDDESWALARHTCSKRCGELGSKSLGECRGNDVDIFLTLVGSIVALYGAFPDLCGASAGHSRSTPCLNRVGKRCICARPPCTAAGHMPAPPCVSRIVVLRARELGKWRRRKGNRGQRSPLVTGSC